MLVPVAEIPGKAWSLLERGADNPMAAMHLLTLATVSADGRPSARLMVNRGCDRETGKLWFHTDGAMPKVGELRANPFACVTGWESAMGVQLRVFGGVILREHDAVSDRHWEQMSAAAQWLYTAGRSLSSSPEEPPDLRLPRDAARLPHKLTARERAHFVVIEVNIETIDWLQATQSEQRPAVLRREAGWEAAPA